MKRYAEMKIVAYPAVQASRQAPAVDCVYVGEDAPGASLELHGPIVLGIRLAVPSATTPARTW